MEELKVRDPLIERRHYQANHNDLWTNLTIAQKFSASSLTQYGYELAYIRRSNTESLAIMLLDGNATTINGEGEIDTSPNITLR